MIGLRYRTRVESRWR
ncbi:hypothetical protein [Halorubrum aquaticum]